VPTVWCRAAPREPPLTNRKINRTSMLINYHFKR
jgi:hypothetical protein